MLKGTLDMMILRTLLTGDANGHTIAKVIERTSEDVLEIKAGLAISRTPSPRRPRLALLLLGQRK
jgi:hypothetical protein